MSNCYLKKVIATTLALTVVLSAGSAIPTSGSAYAEGSKSQLHSRSHTRTNDAQRRVKEPRSFPIFEEAAGIIGVKPDELKKEVAQGKSIADVAKAKGVSEETLLKKLIAIRSSKLDEAVRAGKLPADKAARIKQSMSEHLKFMLNKKGLSDHHWHAQHMPLNPDKLAAMLGISREELAKELKSGKSLAEIAQSKGISRDQLIAKIKDELTPMIERNIDSKHTKEE